MSGKSLGCFLICASFRDAIAMCEHAAMTSTRILRCICAHLCRYFMFVTVARANKLEHRILLRRPRCLLQKTTACHVNARKEFFNYVRNANSQNISILINGFDKGVPKAVCYRLDELQTLPYLYKADTPGNFLLRLCEWSVDFECYVHIAMTAQEKGASVAVDDGTTLEDEIDVAYICVESLKNHTGDLLDHSIGFVARMCFKPCNDRTEDVLVGLSLGTCRAQACDHAVVIGWVNVG